MNVVRRYDSGEAGHEIVTFAPILPQIFKAPGLFRYRQRKLII